MVNERSHKAAFVIRQDEVDKDYKKKMQMKEDFGVFVTMAIIVFLVWTFSQLISSILKCLVESGADAISKSGLLD